MIVIVWFTAYWLMAFVLWNSGMSFSAGVMSGAGWLFWQRVFVRALDLMVENEEQRDGT